MPPVALEHLRSVAMEVNTSGSVKRLCLEAADEIEQLRARCVTLDNTAKINLAGAQSGRAEAERLQKIVDRKNDQAFLGCATTEQLISELRARVWKDGKLDYRPVDRKTHSEVTGSVLYRLARAIHEEENPTKTFEELGQHESVKMFERASDLLVMIGSLAVRQSEALITYKGKQI